MLDRPDLTAVCVLMDVMAIGALEAARSRGLDVPGDLTVTGYDDIPQATAAGLTSMRTGSRWRAARPRRAGRSRSTAAT